MKRFSELLYELEEARICWRQWHNFDNASRLADANTAIDKFIDELGAECLAAATCNIKVEPASEPTIIWKFSDDGLEWVLSSLPPVIDWVSIHKLTLNDDGTWTREVVR